MTPSKVRSVVVATSVALGGGAARADDSVYVMMSNRIGLLAYCKAQGALAADVADAAIARYSLARKTLKAPTSPESAAKMEEAGKHGRWGTRGIAVADHAKVLNQTLAEFCVEHAE